MPNSSEVVDLTGATPPRIQRTARKRRAATTLIDLTVQEPMQCSTVQNADESMIDVIYEHRRSAVPPVRMGRSSRNVSTVDLDDSDSDLPYVVIASKKPTPEAAIPAQELNMPQCSICLESVPSLQANNVDLIVTNACGHFFCRPCMDESLKISKTCPRCRKALRGRTPYKKFFF